MASLLIHFIMENSGKPLLVEAKALQNALKEKKEKVILVDTRAPDVHAKEHIPNAVNINECFTFLAKSDDAGVKELENKFVDLFGKAGITGSDEWVVFYEEGMASGFAQSCRGFYLLKWLGHPKVSVLHGGIVAWKKEGGEVTATPSNPTATSFKAKINHQIMASLKDVQDSLHTGGKTVLLDVRDKDEWIGESSSPYGKDFAPRKGRLPNAKWIEWYDLMEKKDGITYCKDNSNVLKTLAQQNIKPEDDVIVYCFKGSRASNTLLMMYDAGFKNVRNYFGSWNEWSRDDKLPIDDKKLSS